MGTQWHQTFFDNPTSLALKAQLANTYHLAGVGIWALGMEGDTPAMQAALEGSAPVVKGLRPGPDGSAVTTTTTTAPANYTYTGTWNGAAGDAHPRRPGRRWSAPTSAPASAPLTGFATNDPTRTVPGVRARSLSVLTLAGSPGIVRRHDDTAGRLRRGHLGVHRAPAGPPGDTSTTTTTSSVHRRPTTTTTTTTTSTTIGSTSTIGPTLTAVSHHPGVVALPVALLQQPLVELAVGVAGSSATKSTVRGHL